MVVLPLRRWPLNWMLREVCLLTHAWEKVAATQEVSNHFLYKKIIAFTRNLGNNLKLMNCAFMNETLGSFPVAGCMHDASVQQQQIIANVTV